MFSNNYECENQMNIFDFLDNDEQKIKEGYSDFSKYMNKPEVEDSKIEGD